MARRARNPIGVLAVVAAVPAVLLGSLTVYARGKMEPDTIPTATLPVVAPPELVGPLLSLRRSPATLASDVRSSAVSTASQQLLSGIDATSCAVVSLNDRVVATTNETLALIPASNLKVLVAAVALEVLGEQFTFSTQVLGPQPIDGVVRGDVHLVGGGDPVLSEAWYTQPSTTRKRPPIHATSIESLADALKSAGITRITGRLVVDDSRYDAERYPPGWSDDIRSSSDGVPVGALVVNDSTNSAGALSTDPTGAASSTFVRLLETRGISVEGGRATGAPVAGLPVLASVQSAPLPLIVEEMLSTSDNLTAEMMLKEIGRAAGGAGTRAAGVQVILQRLADWGVPTAGVNLTDGSGLSRDNSVPCATFITVLQRFPASSSLGAGMARAGEAGTTLADTYTRDGLNGVVQAKTGSLTGVKSLGGYFVAGTDEVQFIVIQNGPTATDYLSVWDDLADVLLAAAATPTADSLALAGS